MPQRWPGAAPSAIQSSAVAAGAIARAPPSYPARRRPYPAAALSAARQPQPAAQSASRCRSIRRDCRRPTTTTTSASRAVRRILITAGPARRAIRRRYPYPQRPCRHRHPPPASPRPAARPARSPRWPPSGGPVAGAAAGDARLPDRVRARSMDRQCGAAGGAALVPPAGRRDQTDLGLFLPRHERQSQCAYFRACLRQCARRRRIRSRRRPQDQRAIWLAGHARGAGLSARRAGSPPATSSPPCWRRAPTSITTITSTSI